MPIFESVIKTVLVAAAHFIILHIVVVFCCFYGRVNSTELGNEFSIEESKENDFIIKVATGSIKMRTSRNLLFSQTVQAVRINNQGAPLLGLAKSIHYYLFHQKTLYLTMLIKSKTLLFTVVMQFVLSRCKL